MDTFLPQKLLPINGSKVWFRPRYKRRWHFGTFRAVVINNPNQKWLLEFEDDSNGARSGWFEPSDIMEWDWDH